MSDTPFFRGQNRTDWLFAVMLQTAVDYFGPAEIQQVAELIGDPSVTIFPTPGNLFPRVVVVTTDEFVFVVSASTKNLGQWVGNVLASSATPFPPASGTVHAYFGAVALAQYLQCRSTVLAALPGKKLVFIGFSLGAASCEIMLEMFQNADSVSGAACIAFGNPRPGTAGFISAYPSSLTQEFGLLGDPVPSLPPIPWSAIGLFSGVIPLPPLAFYGHVTGGNTLAADGTISSGFTVVGVGQVLDSLADGTAVETHIQSAYAKAIRTQGMPEKLVNGFDGYRLAGSLDNVAESIFYWARPWHWADGVLSSALTKGEGIMTCVASIYIRNKATPPLAFQEIYYLPTDTVSTALTTFTGVATPSGGSNSRQQILAGSLLDQRLGFLSKSCEIYAFRASHVGSPKASRVLKFVTPGTGKINSDTDTIEASISYFGFSPNQRSKRQFHFRGIAASWLDGDNVDGNGVTIGIPLIEGWLQTLKDKGVVILADNNTIASGTRVAGAQKVGQSDPITLLLAANPGFTENQLCTLTGCKKAPLLNGKWLVGLTTPNTSIILKGSNQFSAPADLAGSIRAADIQGFSLDSWQFNGVSAKKTGRPSYLQRGRASARVRHR